MSGFWTTSLQKMTAILLAMALLCLVPLEAEGTSLQGVSVASSPLTRSSGTVNGMVRVFLSSLGSPSTLRLTVRGRYSLNGEFLSDGDQVTVQFDASTGNLSLTHNGVTFHAGRSASLRRHNAAGTNGILIAQSRDSQNPYPGDLSFEAVASGGQYRLYTIAHIYLEDYLYGVLPYEMGNASSMEALKAQAVAARTYTVRMMRSRASGLYDVQDTTSDQVYRGTPSGNANCVAAVDATRGIVLMSGGNYITTYYSASNGGQTEISRTGDMHPYMKVKDDPFDYANPDAIVRRKTIYANLESASNPAGLTLLLRQKAAQKLGVADVTPVTLKSVTPHTPKYASPSRLYSWMDFTFTVSTGQTVTVTCDIFRELEGLLGMGIQSLDNELWTVERSGGNFVLQARRYGHGMGMSQRGAMYMGRLGYSYDQILGFYYEGCQRVQHSFTQTILSASSTEQEWKVEEPAELENHEDDACRGTVKLTHTGDRLAIRALASSASDILGTASNGAILTVLASKNGWYLVRYGEICGYVPGSALTVTGTPPQTEAQVSQVAGFVTVTASDFVNLRKSASASAEVLGTAPAGAVLTVLSREGAWLRIQYNRLTAYVSANYVSAVSGSYPQAPLSTGGGAARVTGEAVLRQTPSPVAAVLCSLAPGTLVAVDADDGTWAQVRHGGQTGYVLSECLIASPEETPEEGQQPAPGTDGVWACVATDSGSLNLRAQAYKGSQIMAHIPRGATVWVTQRGEEWCAVTYAGMQGYAMTSFLRFENTPATTPSSYGAACVNTASGSLNLRREPEGKLLGTIPRSAPVEVLAYGDNWCRVRYGNLEGYVKTGFLRFEEPKTPEEETSRPPEEQPKEEPVAPPQEELSLPAWVSTSSGSLNLREKPEGGARIVCAMPRLSKVTLLEKEKEWCRVQYGRAVGYAMTRYLTEGEPPEERREEAPIVASHGQKMDATLSAPDKATFATIATDGSLQLWSMCDKAGSAMGRVPAGETVEIILRGDSWCLVAYGEIQGYCLTSELSGV